MGQVAERPRHLHLLRLPALGGPLEADEELMAEAGYESIFKQEKGYEAYEYFDASADPGVLVEVKEHYR